MDSMSGKRFEPSDDNFPRTKIKNVCCVQCKHCFIVKDFPHLRGPRIPFLLECGHPICSGCIQSNQLKSCPTCKCILSYTDNQKLLSSVNVYTLGLMLAISKRPIQTQEPDISFQQRLTSRLKHAFNQGQCHECGIQAAVSCRQCAALYCSPCYAKIHGRALQSHKKNVLLDSSNHVMAVPNVCSEVCSEPPGYYCKGCAVSCCSHCMLRSHAMHKYMPLEEKNKELMPEFYGAYEKVVECFQQVLQTQKKLKTISTFPTEYQNSEVVEGTISQHFVYLHGLLQNLEKRLIKDLCQQRDYLTKTVHEISAQLQMQEEQLQSAMVMAVSAKENPDTVDMQEVILKLQEVADLPCHLVQNPVQKSDKIEFGIDGTVVEAIEKHCTIQVPAISCLNLMPTRLLPEDYEMEPLTQEFKIPKLLNKSSASASKSATPTLSVDSRKSDKIRGVLSQGTFVNVRVTHIVDPLCFYVQQLDYKANLKQLNDEVEAYSKHTLNVPTEIIQNKLYVVQRKKDNTWHRGRIMKINSRPNNEETYKIFYVDDGTEDDNVTKWQMRNVSPQISTLPMMAIKCSLYDIVPTDAKWLQGAIDTIWELVDGDAVVTMHIIIIRGNTYYVDLSVNRMEDGNGPVSVRDTLIFRNYGSFHSRSSLMRTNPQSTQQFYRNELVLEKFEDVVVQFIESLDSIFVLKIKNIDYMNKVLTRMADDYEKNEASKGMIYLPEEKLPCAARGVDGIWSRAIISKVINDKEVKVFFVDLGYSLMLDPTNLRKLEPVYMETPVQAIRVSVKNIQPLDEDNGEWSSKTIDFAKQILSNKTPVRIIAFEKIEDVYSCQLIVEGVDFGGLLAGKSLAQNVGAGSKRDPNLSPAEFPPPTRPANKRKDNKKKKNDSGKKRFQKSDIGVDENYVSKNIVNRLSVSKDDNTDPFKIRVHIHHIKSPDCIYISEKSREQSYAKMLSSMQEFYNKYRSKGQEVWKEGAVCAAYSAKDKSYFRAKILTIRSTEEVDAFFYDMAIEEVIHPKHIQTLHPDFLKIPAFLFKVKLAGILPCGGSTTWPSLSCESLSDIANENPNSKFYISKAEDTADGAIPVDLWVKQSKTEGPLLPTRVEINCVNRMLVNKGVALPIKNYAQKRDKILAIDLKRELNEKPMTRGDPETDVKWFTIDDDLNTSGRNRSPHPRVESQLDVCSTDSQTSESDPNEAYTETLPTFGISQWKPPEPIKQNEFIGIPTYVDHDGAIYIHSKRQNGKTLRLIESKLSGYYKKRKLQTCDMAWQEGDICIAQYHHNKKWYRGKVVKLLKNDMVEVEFVDYGNVEDCEIGTLLKKVILDDIPIQCTKCIISGLHPNTVDRKWKLGDLDIIHALLVEKECKVTILKRHATHLVVTIKLSKPCDRDLIKYLIEDLNMSINTHGDDFSETTEEDVSSFDTADVVIEKYVTHPKADLSLETRKFNDAIISSNAVPVEKHNGESNDVDVITDFDNISWIDLPGSSSKLVSSTPRDESEESLLSHYMALKIPNDTDTLDVEVCFISGPTVYYLHIRENDESTTFGHVRSRYKELMADMQSNADAQPKIETLKPNTSCCTKFRDDVWYRCLIKKCVTANQGTDELKVSLLYVDFGNEELRTVDPNNLDLRILKEEWLDVPAMAIKCQLWDVENVCDTDSDHILVPTLNQLYGMSLTAKVKKIQESCLWAELYADKACTKLAYESLIENCLFSRKEVTEA